MQYIKTAYKTLVRDILGHFCNVLFNWSKQKMIKTCVYPCDVIRTILIEYHMLTLYIKNERSMSFGFNQYDCKFGTFETQFLTS